MPKSPREAGHDRASRIRQRGRDRCWGRVGADPRLRARHWQCKGGPRLSKGFQPQGRHSPRNLQSKKGKSGKPRFKWYADFTAVLLEICANNGIEPTVGVDDVSGAARGGLAQLASGFERLLPLEMRSPTPTVMVKRLQRSLKRLREKPQSVAA